MRFNKKSRQLYTSRRFKKSKDKTRISFKIEDKGYFLYIFNAVLVFSLFFSLYLFAKRDNNFKTVKAKKFQKVKVKTHKIIEKKEEIKKEEIKKEEKIYKVPKNKKRRKKRKKKRRKKKPIKKEATKDIVKKTKKDIPKKETKEVKDIPKKDIWGLNKDSFAKSNTGAGISIKAGNNLDKDYDEILVDKDKIPEKEDIAEYDEDEVTTAPRFIRRVPPRYTEEALEDEIEGVVVLEALVDKNGQILSIKTKKTPGYGLEKEAIKALKLSKISAAKLDEKNVKCIMEFRYRFKIRFD